MKVFISWSGDLSHEVAVILQAWLPNVIQIIEAYVSSENIDKGARWSADIAKELEDSFFGILCITSENVEAPWVNFEAGALSKAIDKSRVCPFLFGIKRSEVKGPLLQFQSTICDKEDVKKLLRSMNRACDKNALDEGRLDKIFDVWWPKLQEKLDALQSKADAEKKSAGQHPEKKLPPANAMVEEILELVRSQQTLLQALTEKGQAEVPIYGLRSALARANRTASDLSNAISILHVRYTELKRLLPIDGFSVEQSMALRSVEQMIEPLLRLSIDLQETVKAREAQITHSHTAEFSIAPNSLKPLPPRKKI